MFQNSTRFSDYPLIKLAALKNSFTFVLLYFTVLMNGQMMNPELDFSVKSARAVPINTAKDHQIFSSDKLRAPCVSFSDTVSIGGSVTVAGNVYPTLTEAFFDLAQCGIDKSILLSLNASYSSNAEVFPIVIPDILGSGAANVITVKPAAGVTKTISGSSPVAIFKLSGAGHIIIDGSNLPAGTTKDLSITNTDSSVNAAVIWIASTLAKGCGNITVKNAVISGNSGTTTAGNVIISGTVMGTEAEFSNSNISITGNTITKAQNAIFAIGNAATPDQNWNFSNNFIGASANSDKGFRGITVQHATSFTISKNTVSGISIGTTDTSSGILIGGVASNGIISNNKISNVRNMNPAGYGSNGIFLNASTVSSDISVYNNMIWDIASIGDPTLNGVQDNGYGLVINNGGGYKIYYNSINMTTNQTRGNSAALNVTINVTTPGAIDLRNNILANTQTANTRYAVYSGAANTVFNNIDYNNYFSAGILGFIKGSRTTLANWQTGTGRDLNSLNIAPPFVSAVDLHLAACDSFSLTAIPIPGISTDFDEEVRSAIIPDMGADEFIDGLPLTIVSVVDGFQCGAGTVNLSASGSLGTTQYLWYASATAPDPIAVTADGTFTTPEIDETTVFYVVASNGLCTGEVRTPVIATINEAPSPILLTETTFPANATGCDVAFVQVNAVGGTMWENTLLDEDFNTIPVGSGNLPVGWSAVNPFDAFTWGAFNTNAAEGVPNEMRLLYSPSGQNGNGTWILNAPVIDTKGLTAVKASFKYALGFLAPGSFDVKLQTSVDNSTWVDQWFQTFNSVTGNDVFTNDPAPMEIDLSELDGNSQINVRFTVTGNSAQLSFFALDDVKIYTTVQNPITWSPSAGLFLDAALQIPYIAGVSANQVYAAPDNATQFTALSSNLSCSVTATTSSIVQSREIFIGLDLGNSNLWNQPLNWSSNALPSVDKCVVIPAGKNVLVNIPNAVAKKITVESGGKLTINANQTLTLEEGLINMSAPEDVTIASDGNLIQISSSKTINSGGITAEREIVNLRYEPGVNVDYIYWSSPVEGQLTKGSKGFSPGTPNAAFFDYRESNDRFYQTDDVTFISGKGYAVRAENGMGSPYTKTYRFQGVPANGDFNVPISRSANTGTTENVIHGYNLVGNPYPSNISFEKLYQANSGLIWNSAWFWTNTSYTQYQQGSSYTGNNYAVYNGTGGNAATKFAGSPSAASKPTGLVKVGQGFLVQKKDFGTGNLVFKNAYGAGQNLRVGTAGNFYYKNAAPKNRFTLQLISPDQSVNSLLIGYVEGATDDFEQDFDAETTVLSSNLFYSSLGDKRLLIQGKSAFKSQDKVHLGANFFANGIYTISSYFKEGIFENGQKIYLKDRQNGITTDLSQGSYTFSAGAGEDSSRFEIHYEPQTVLSAASSPGDEINIFRVGTDFLIRANAKKITQVEIYDASGRLLHQKSANDKEIRLEGSHFLRGIYILKIYQKENLSIKKIIR